MNAKEKEQIYNLLKTSSSYVYGYTTSAFKTNPVFTDDNVQKAASETEKKSASATGTATLAAVASGAAAAVQSAAASVQSAAASVQGAPDSAPGAAASEGSVNLKSVAEKISRCTRCSLARTRNNVVPGVGVENPEVLVIGEGPGYEEDMKGEPFVGKAGLLLDKMLNAINLSRKTNCYIANVVKCRPPQNRDPLPEEMDACFSFLEVQIKLLKPKMILCMGRISGQKLLKTQTPLTQLRGKMFDYNGIPLMITYHPSALLRNEALKKPAWEDLKLFKRKLDELRNVPSSSI